MVYCIVHIVLPGLGDEMLPINQDYIISYASDEALKTRTAQGKCLTFVSINNS